MFKIKKIIAHSNILKKRTDENIIKNIIDLKENRNRN
jgi:hypothetical protein